MTPPPLSLGKSAKVLIGLATAWPIVYLFIFMSFIFYAVFAEGFAPRGASSEGPPKAFLLIFALHFLTMLWIFALLGFYMLFLYRTDRVEKDKKALWAVVLFLGNMIAMPIFFFLYIWRDPAPKVGGARPPAAG